MSHPKEIYPFNHPLNFWFKYKKRIIFYSILFLILYSSICLLIISFADNKNTETALNFQNNGPDLIVVYTGDKGRIPFAFKKAKYYSPEKVFITGVNTKTTINSILGPLNQKITLDREQLVIDYLAKNTVENVIATLRHLRKNPQFKQVLIISHDYHLLRIKLILDRIKNHSDLAYFSYMGVRSDYTNFRNLKILYTEVFKLIRAYAFLLLWDPELPSIN